MSDEIESIRSEHVQAALSATSDADSPTWPYVLAFAKRMEAKLDANRHKGDREGLLEMHPHDLLRRVRDEADEMEDAILSDHSTEDVWDEAADVANFALMAADAYDFRAALAAASEGAG